MPKPRRPLLTLRFKNRVDGRTITAKIYSPQRKRLWMKETKRYAVDWQCKLEVREKRKLESLKIYGVDWLQSFQLALRGFREIYIAREEETDWESDGCAAWTVFPHQIDISFGYQVYSKARAAAEKIEQRHWRKPAKK